MAAPRGGKRRRTKEEHDDIADEADIAEEMAAAGLISIIPGKEIKNTAGLKMALKGFQQKLPWMQRLDVTAGYELDVPDVNDDLSRELQFYNQALAAVKAARTEWERVGHSHYRPDDYFAEMLKTDGHMAKVKTRLLSEQKRMEAFEERRRAQSARKFSKAVQAEKTKSKAADKKSSLAAIENWKKTKASRGGAVVDEQSSKQLEAMLSGSGHKISAPGAVGGGKPRAAAGAAGGAKSGKYVAPRSNAKRRYKDTKFGFGGAKRHAKDGDRKSTNNVSSFSMKANRSLPTGFKSKNKPATGARPGKRRRDSMRK